MAALATAVWLGTYAPDGVRDDLAREALRIQGSATAFYPAHDYEDVGAIEHRIDGVAHENRVLVGPPR